MTAQDPTWFPQGLQRRWGKGGFGVNYHFNRSEVKDKWWPSITLKYHNDLLTLVGHQPLFEQPQWGFIPIKQTWQGHVCLSQKKKSLNMSVFHCFFSKTNMHVWGGTYTGGAGKELTDIFWRTGTVAGALPASAQRPGRTINYPDIQ